MTDSQGRVLHLFSSDNRALYLEDCLNLLAKPAGSVQRFRYQRHWVSVDQSRRPITDAQWNALATESTRVIVYYVSASSPKFGETVYLPLRTGKVTRSYNHGDYLFVDFALDSYPNPTTFQPTAASLPKLDPNVEASVRDYSIALSAEIRSMLGGRFPAGTYSGGLIGEFSAVIGDVPVSDGTGSSSTEDSAFGNTARVLLTLLDPDRHADAPSASAMIRVARLRRIGKKGHAASSSVNMTSSPLTLASATHYALDVFQISRGKPGMTLSVHWPTSVSAVTATSIAISSPYDIATFEFFTAPRDNPTVGEIEVRSEPNPSTPKAATGDRFAYPVARLPVRIQPPRSLFTWSVLAALGTTLAAIILALGALNGVFLTPPKDEAGTFNLLWFVPDAYLGIDIAVLLIAALAGLGTGVTAFVALRRRRLGLAG